MTSPQPCFTWCVTKNPDWMSFPEDTLSYGTGSSSFYDWYYAGSLDGTNGRGNPALIELDPDVQQVYI